MNQIINFEFESKAIRVITDETTGEPMWVANDICDVLGYKNSRDALAKLDDDERGVSEIPTPGGPQELNTINESGLYTLILRSNKPESKPFKRWVTHEVLPSIRKYGRYEACREPELPKPKMLQLSDNQISYLLERASMNVEKAIAINEILMDFYSGAQQGHAIFGPAYEQKTNGRKALERSISQMQNCKANIDEINRLLYDSGNVRGYFKS